MTASNVAHWDVASYALGILEPGDARHFEEHLADCQECAGELAGLLPVTTMLSQVDRGAAVRAWQIVQDGDLLDRMTNVVRLDRRRGRRRVAFGVAAAVAASAAVAAYAAITVNVAPGSQPDRPPVAVGSSSAPANLPAGDHFANTDATSGVHLEVVAHGQRWGTQIGVNVSRLSGPLTCRLIAVNSSGGTEIVATWKVPTEGYGTVAQPEPLSLTGATGMNRTDIRRVELQSVASNGAISPLASLAL